jgi:hypothetical protein
MTRVQRRRHLWLWLILAPALLAGLLLSVVFHTRGSP